MAIINASGIIQMANKMAQQLFGYRKGELEGKNVSGPLAWPCGCAAGLALRPDVHCRLRTPGVQLMLQSAA